MTNGSTQYELSRQCLAACIACLLLGVATGAPALPPADSPPMQALKAGGASVAPDKEGGLRVSFQDWKLDAAGWKALESLPDVRIVWIGNAKNMDNAQFARLCQLKSIESLFVNGFPGSDEALKHLADLPNLKHFGADHSQFTGTGLVALKNSPNFASIRFGGCPFDDDGMKAVGELTQLKKANISHVRFTSAGFPNFGKLVNLEELAISPNCEPYYVGADFVHLAGLKKLETLRISEMALTYEDGLYHLKDLKNLKLLELKDCRISDADLARLKADLPGTTIDRSFSLDQRFKQWDASLERRRKLAEPKK